MSAALHWTTLQFVYRAAHACVLPAHKGSLFRGGLGHALHARDRAAFALLFDARQGERGDQRQPYVVAAPPDERTEFEPGDQLEFGLTLLGPARACTAALRDAADLAGLWGFGVTRSCWSLASARTLELNSNQLLAWLPWSPTADLELLSPADLCRDGRPARTVDSELLVRRTVGRVHELAEAYCGGDPFDRPAALASAATLRCTATYLERVRWERYSSTHGGKHPLSGLRGTLHLEAVAEELWPYLVVGQWWHLGKGSSFGMGQYALLPRPDARAARGEKVVAAAAAAG
jgi:hypothetical protein